ncbi:DNA ligase D [Aquamicrobium sp. LC103]|uniref:DNA ligase D n=1 Tax=Aquamicrobium sp. LC103 TaxID=1120658 RepID=UPI00063EA62B|nr:DNA ligase D [Aquamicrobium sp. LC103]TKT80052.1 DNA ligase D [Aquamicrobium sp. LC103]
MAKPEIDELLKDYRAKRDFSKTSEPAAETARKAGKRAKNALSFVVQKHDATRLHYDFRLEWDGVLKSWAVTRGPSYDPAEKRLAVRTEDHPLAYGGFEGVIPRSQYGGGTVMLWDTGIWEPVEDFDKGLKNGKLVFRLHGERLEGEWTLVRMKPRDGETRENWLMIKHREEGFRPPRGDVLKKYVKSVASDRTMAQIAKGGRTLAKSDLTDRRPAKRTPKAKAGAEGKEDGKRKSSAVAMPRWREVQLATLVAAPPEGGEWLSEMKYDGYRALLAIAGGKAKVFTRSGLDWTAKFPGIAAAAAALDTDGALIDGEIVAFDGNGKTNFSALQDAISSGGQGLSCFCFDLLEEDGEDIRRLPLVERKARLEELLGEGSAPLIYSTHVAGSAEKVFDQVCGAGHEGIVAKRADDPYRSGRGRSWLKVKCTKSQEFVIGGYTPTDKKNRPFRSLLVGVRENGRLVYKGRVGAFEGNSLAEAAPLILEHKRASSPFSELPREAARKAKFVEPDLVAEIGFAEFTSDGVVRHGVFKGLREDKKAGEVVLERAEGAPMPEREKRQEFAGVKLSSPDKVLFEEEGVTKADIAAHYERVAERMMPEAGGRLLSLVRCPDGTSGECFFQKHESRGFPKELKRLEVTEADGKKDNYLHVEGLSGIIAGVQMGTLEFHIWGSRIDRIEQPDRLVFDLDPDEGLGFRDVRDAAFDLRERLAGIGLETLAMVTGGKGVHVIAPLARRAEWPEVKAFARDFSRMIAEEEPERYVAQAAKAKRKGRIFVDWLRNERGATAISPYSTRARKGAPIATPVSWEELKSLDAANVFHLGDMEKRLAMADPWAQSAGWKQSITKKMLAKVAAA